MYKKNGNYEKFRKALVVGAVFRSKPVRGNEEGAISKVVERTVTDDGVFVKTVSISADGRVRHNHGCDLSFMLKHVQEILHPAAWDQAERAVELRRLSKVCSEVNARLDAKQPAPFVPNEGPTNKALEVQLVAMKEEVRQLKLRVSELEGYMKVGRSATKPADPTVRQGAGYYRNGFVAE